MKINGKFNTAEVFTQNIEETAKKQIINLLNQKSFKDSKVRIMPDTHAGAGCVIGFTADLGDKVIPNLVGVDIGCGMHVVKFKSDINLQAVDNFIKKSIPSGMNVNNNISIELIDALHRLELLSEIDRVSRITNTKFTRHLMSIGSLGGGNHFIEINKDSEGCKYLVVHSGSRNFGLQIAKYHQKEAERHLKRKIEYLNYHKNKYIASLKMQGKNNEIQDIIKDFDKEIKQYRIPKELSYLENKERYNYLNDMRVAQRFASLNRQIIIDKIIAAFKLNVIEQFETIHNYISDDNIIRKGAVCANDGIKLIIPINMRDGSIIAIGKGNKDWNNSAPHGAGRLMSRSEAKEQLDLNEYKETMKNVFSTSVKESTLDEAPDAYKPMKEIINNIKDTVEIVEIIKPIYNFKA